MVNSLTAKLHHLSSSWQKFKMLDYYYHYWPSGDRGDLAYNDMIGAKFEQCE